MEKCKEDRLQAQPDSGRSNVRTWFFLLSVCTELASVSGSRLLLSNLVGKISTLILALPEKVSLNVICTAWP